MGNTLSYILYFFFFFFFLASYLARAPLVCVCGCVQYTPADIQWVLDEYRPLLRRFGYDQLYEAWLAGAAGAFNASTLQDHVRTIMHNTAETANWGEAI